MCCEQLVFMAVPLTAVQFFSVNLRRLRVEGEGCRLTITGAFDCMKRSGGPVAASQ